MYFNLNLNNNKNKNKYIIKDKTTSKMNLMKNVKLIFKEFIFNFRIYIFLS